MNLEVPQFADVQVVTDVPAQRVRAVETKHQPDYVKIYSDLAQLAFAAGNIEQGEQYRSMAESFQL